MFSASAGLWSRSNVVVADRNRFRTCPEMPTGGRPPGNSNNVGQESEPVGQEQADKSSSSRGFSQWQPGERAKGRESQGEVLALAAGAEEQQALGLL